MKIRTRFVSLLLAQLVALAPLPARAATPQPPPPQQQSMQATDALRRGRDLLKRGRADEALPLLEAALKLYAVSGSTRGQAAAHDALGDLYARQGQSARALPHYKEAYEKFLSAERKTESTAAAADALTRTNTGSQVAKFSDAGFNANLMLAKTGETQYRVGDVAGSGATYARMNVKKPEGGAASKLKRFGGFGGFGGIGLGGGTKVDIASTAAGVAGSAYSIQKNFDFYRESVLYATYSLGLGRVAYHGGNLEGARKNFQDALDVLGSNLPGIGNVGQIRRFRVAARTALGDVALRSNNPKDALKLYTDAAKGAKDDKRPDLAWPALRGQGRARLALAAQERPGAKRVKLQEESVASYREALQIIETLRQGSVRADESRATFLATTKDVFDEASSALAEMALSTGAAAAGGALEGQSLAYAAEGFRVVEQGRARSLLDMLSEMGGTPSEGIPAELLKRKNDNLDRQHRIAQDLSGVSLTGEPPKESVEKLEEELEKLSTEYDSIENDIRRANPRYGALTAAQPLALAEVQQQVLDDATVLAEYSLGRESSYLWLVTKTGVSLFRLPGREEVEKRAATFRDQIVPQSLRRSIVELAGGTRGLGDERGLGTGNAAVAPAVVAAYSAAAHELYKTVLAPAAPLVGDKRLLVVADGALNYVPFEALVTTAEGGADYSVLPYLVKTNEVVYAPSASVVAAVRQQSGATRAGTGMLVVADPVFDPADARAAKTQAAQAGAARNSSVEAAVADVSGASAPASGSFRLSRLAGTRTEAQEIGKLARAGGLTPDIWLDLDANEGNLRTRDITKYGVVHVATHGLLNTERPQFTGVVLSLVGNADADGFLRTDEIFNLRLGAQLVVLSACETGLGREKRGEGVIGLTRAFMYAGAPTVGVSLWSVGDKSTAELMSDFYKRLLTKQSPSPPAAMRAAQQGMIAGKRYSAPFYWAPFVLVGDWNGK